METQFFIPIIILLGFATIASVLLKVFKLNFLPVFAIEILIGLVIANWFNGLMLELNLENITNGIYTIGLSMLIFLSGYEVEFDIASYINTDEISDRKPKQINILKVGLTLTLFSYLSAFIISFFLRSYITGDKITGIILLTLVFASTFAALVVPILVENSLMNTTIGKTLATIADMSEALSIILLSILMIVIDVDRKYWYIIGVIIIILFTFTIFRKFKIGKYFSEFSDGIDHLVTRIIIITMLIFVLLSNLAGGEYILGAFLAGIVVRRAKFSEKVMHSLERIIYGIFAPMFFIIVGTTIDITSILSDLNSILLVLFLALMLLIVELPVLYLLKWYNWKTVVPSLVLMSCTIIVPIAAREINHHLHSVGRELFTDNFAQALILASLLICILGTIFFAMKFPFKSLKKEKEGVDINHG